MNNWNKPSLIMPPKGILVETMDSAGKVQDLIFDHNLWFHSDKATYVYYTPLFWRFK